METDFARGLADQRSFGLDRTPRLVCDAAEREPGFDNSTVLHIKSGGNGDQREGITCPVADLAVGRVASQRKRWQFDCGDQFAWLEERLDVGSFSRQAMEIGKRDRSRAAASL